MKLRIATRKSPLALWQANYVKNKLLEKSPALEIELVEITTSADKFLDTPLTKIGGKGLFVKELESALLELRVDCAVHSIKDLPAFLPDGLMIAAICEREDPRDALVCLQPYKLSDLPAKSRIGTSSLRRQCQTLALRPDLEFRFLRGNVGLRLEKLIKGEYDAIILAAAGLKRLHETKNVVEYFNPSQFIPAIGQGAIGIECRRDDIKTQLILAELDHLPTRICVTAERAFNEKFGGNCQIPLAAHAILENNELKIDGLFGRPDGSVLLRDHQRGKPEQALELGHALAANLFAQGAGEILKEIP